MRAKDIFISFKNDLARQQKRLDFYNSINIQNQSKNTTNTPNQKHKKKYIKQENTISQEELSKTDCGFVCEYVEFFVLGSNKKKL